MSTWEGMEGTLLEYCEKGGRRKSRQRRVPERGEEEASVASSLEGKNHEERESNLRAGKLREIFVHTREEGESAKVRSRTDPLQKCCAVMIGVGNGSKRSSTSRMNGEAQTT